MSFRDLYEPKQEVEVRLEPEGWMRGRVRLVARRYVTVAVLYDDGRFYVEAEITRRRDIRRSERNLIHD